MLFLYSSDASVYRAQGFCHRSARCGREGAQEGMPKTMYSMGRDACSCSTDRFGSCHVIDLQLAAVTFVVMLSC